MLHIYPAYYKKFRCIADKCPDSCCKDWDVVVDKESEEFYNTVGGEIGKRLREVMVTDSDGDRIFTLENGRCPFWNKDKLCDIYKELGEEHLCSTCKSFPRISQDFGAFTEHNLSFACPEAARLMLEEKNAYADFSCEYDLSGYEYDKDILDFLLKARQETVNILSGNIISFPERLSRCLEYNSSVQAELDGYVSEQNPCYSLEAIFELHGRLEYINPKFREIILSNREPLFDVSADKDFEKLAFYFIYRYYLRAVDTYKVLDTLQRIVCAYVVISSIELKYVQSRTSLMQIYSKEIEHSYENYELMEEMFINDERFSPANLCSLLRSIPIRE